MICPSCKADNDRVVDSRPHGTSVRRRRVCNACAYKFTTYEYIDSVPLTVVKRDQTREPFQREKLLSGIRLATTKRPISPETINQMVEGVESQLMATGELEVSFQAIGDLVMKSLARLDPVAYIRFASVYREFKEVDEFVKIVAENN
jgi:transcriptional repressor NrdR